MSKTITAEQELELALKRYIGADLRWRRSRIEIDEAAEALNELLQYTSGFNITIDGYNVWRTGQTGFNVSKLSSLTEILESSTPYDEMEEADE